MDKQKLESILESIEAESASPHGSHAELARLVALFGRELISAVPVVDSTDVEIDTEPEKARETHSVKSKSKMHIGHGYNKARSHH